MNKNELEKKRKKIKIIGAVCAAVLALVLAVLIGVNMFGSQRSVENTLEGYFDALYCKTLIKEMEPYLVEDIRQICYDDFTFYGTSVAILKAHQEEKMAVVGSDLSLTVKVDKEETGSAAALKSASDAYGATLLKDVSFTVTFTGSEGSADFQGIARLAKISGKWYLTEYNLPLEEVAK